MRQVAIAVAVTLVVQALTSMAMIAPSVMAPVVAPALGLAPQTIGVFVSVSYAGAMFSGLAAQGLIARFGAFAVCLAAAVLAGAGLAAGRLAEGAPAPALLLLAAGLAIGIGYGCVNPVSSHILARRAPPGRMAFVFSLKQTGVPIGGAIAGGVVPTLLLAVGWSSALVVLGAACGVAAILCLPARGALRDEPATAAEAPPAPRDGAMLPAVRRAIGGLAGPVRLAVGHPRLRDLAILSFGYAAVQLVFVTYFVAYLHLHLGYTLVTAGAVYAVAHVSGIVGRIVWGAIADRWLAPRRTLAALGALSCACGIAAALFTPAWPVAAVAAVAALYGASAVGWNGVYLAEVARCAPPGQVGRATGGTQFFTFAGALSGPLLYGAAVSLGGSYAWGFVLFAVVPLAAALRLLAPVAGPAKAQEGAR